MKAAWRRILLIAATLFTAKAAPRPSEVEVVAAVLWAEARGEGTTGINAVAEVIRNRTYQPRRWGRTPYEVVTSPLQFACLVGTTPEKLVERARKSSGPDRLAWAYCIGVSKQLLAGSFTNDATGGATHYDCRPQPSWGKVCTVIGNHYFYR